MFGQRLLEACTVGDLGQVKLMLQVAGKLIFFKGKVSHFKTFVQKECVKAGADVNMTSWCRTSPLMEAAKTEQLSVLAFLLTRWVKV